MISVSKINFNQTFLKWSLYEIVEEIQYSMIDLFSNRLKSNFTLKVIEEIIKIKKKEY